MDVIFGRNGERGGKVSFIESKFTCPDIVWIVELVAIFESPLALIGV
jgi:hypothetical protein